MIHSVKKAAWVKEGVVKRRSTSVEFRRAMNDLVYLQQVRNGWVVLLLFASSVLSLVHIIFPFFHLVR